MWISPNPRARLQATGIDAVGRKQYRYHASYRAARERAKFDRLLEFSSRLPRFRSRTARHLRRDVFDREWTCAIAVGVINKSWFRVGADRHARVSKTYGVTTLRKRHMSVEDDVIRFCFRAKNRKLVRRLIRDARLAAGVEELLTLPGRSRLFRFECDGDLVTLNSPLLNAYLREHLGEEFTAKDFRTWGGTLLAAVELDRRGPAESDARAKRTLAAVMRKVAVKLGNTPAVARAFYVSPVVVEHYLAGRTLEEFCPSNGGGPRHVSVSEAALARKLGTPVA